MPVVNQVQLSDAVLHNRFSAEFFDPRYVFSPSPHVEWATIGRLLKKCEYGLSISMNSVGRGFPIFRMNEIEGCFALRPEKYADIPASAFQEYGLCENDVLFNRTNSFEFVGRTGIVKDQTDCTFASYLIRLVPNINKLLPEFLTIYLNTDFGIGQVKRRAMRSINQANVSGSEVRKILIPVLPLPVQQEIADLVNAAFTRQREGLACHAQAQQLLEAELGLDKLMFQKTMSYTALASDLADSRRTDAEYYNPAARAIVRKITALQHTTLRESFGVQSGFPWNSAKFLPDNSGEPVVRIRNIKPNHIIPRELTSIDPSYANSTGVLKARRGDVVVGMDGIRYFYASVLEGECFVNQRVCHLSPRSSRATSPEYTVFMINSIVGQAQLMRDMTVAATVGHITNRDIAKLVVPTISRAFHDEVTGLIRRSIDCKEKSKQLLMQAKVRVEQLIAEALEA
jgi:hypothetical protein